MQNPVPKNRRSWVIGLLAVAVIVAAFFAARMGYRDIPPAANPGAGQAVQRELERLKDLSNREAEEIVAKRKEVPQRVYEYRKAVHMRARMLSPDAVAAELNALLEQSRREQSGDEQL